MKVGDFMTAEVVTVGPDALISEAARLMLDRSISGLPVTDANGHVIGIVTEHDLLRHRNNGPGSPRRHWLQLMMGQADISNESARFRDVRVDEVMTRDPTTVTEDTAVEEACRLIQERGIKRLPVVRDGKLVGIVARADLVRALGLAVSKITDADQRAAHAESLMGRMQLELITRRSRSRS